MSSTSIVRTLPFAKTERDLCPAQAKPAEEVTRLFEELRAPLLRYALSLGLAPDDGEEVVQEAFLALFRHLRSDRSRSNLQGWLFRVVHNHGLKRRTRNSLHVQRHIDHKGPDWELKADPAPNVEQRLLSRHEYRRLQAMLRQLSDRERFCLCLRAEGLRYREIANILGMSLGGVALSLQRSLARLRSKEVEPA